MSRQRVAVSLPDENRDLFAAAAKKANMSMSAFVGLMAAIGYSQILDNPELFAKAVIE